jgi:hypothetical protein
MRTHRFGQKLKIPSTAAIKHGILTMMLQEHLKANGFDTASDQSAAENRSHPFSGSALASSQSISPQYLPSTSGKT